ncbi:uncharacterized protein N0V89_007546 [Didymosphaeria variabile]|uniref:Uncharacterized protein n=1 Tax=Didymosphaeria variabile TaxID=1932322 RepID=A0A9W8XJL2_9PLEO|nr:uncharacterized protein N0V89_007546 [Didymosphaeria variabile]KAJ4352199.1 hypothetical protein N0V89_007546 [Didymosphaeria variabile]
MLPEQFALSILSVLIIKASHIDIRCATTEKILTTLETIVPIAVLLHDTETLKHVNEVQRLLWPFSPSHPIEISCESKLKLLVEAIILYVESLRTREWERDPKRNPDALPSTFPLRMHLLHYSAQHSNHPPGPEEHRAAFTGHVAKLIDQFSNGLYPNKFPNLKAGLNYVRGDNRLRVACSLGDISKTSLSCLTLQDHLWVELAASLLYSHAKENGRQDALAERVETWRQSWRVSGSEEVRKAGYTQWVE